ncbi:MAG: hypothetical protein ISS67_05990 [Desulfobacterales bacterium]|uniref:Uncharacterized protein n=1 Tax=Candidatus Desulfatibia profunda TaxID=2841695 RepID=A0A8J6TGC4_9BACT|nr:hypothetical protein [Candidatus Desulfatibia profunda]MBL7180279.1 hypothetical protein [Desulfobacterales bacterium]MBL7208056.1 hypothetical protein [Desulfobacterales bacterium]
MMRFVKCEMVKRIAGLIRPWWVEFEMIGLLPGRIGRYRITDMLLSWEEQ